MSIQRSNQNGSQPLLRQIKWHSTFICCSFMSSETIDLSSYAQ